MVRWSWVRMFGLCVVLLAFGARGARAEEAWETKLSADLAKVEAEVCALDGKQAEKGTLPQRTKSLHERLKVMEEALSIRVRTISGKKDGVSLTTDCVILGSRASRVREERSKAEGPKAKPDTPTTGPTAPSEEPPADPAPGKAPPAGGPAAPPAPKDGKAGDPPAAPAPEKREYPEYLHWKATASFSYTETGRWRLVPNGSRPTGNEFIHTGYEGSLSFAVRASGLKREVKRATLRVAVTLKEPFEGLDGGRRVYDLEWVPKRALSNDALKHWESHDTLTVSVPERWIIGPQVKQQKLQVFAHVLSLTMKDDTVVKFEAPTYKE